MTVVTVSTPTTFSPMTDDAAPPPTINRPPTVIRLACILLMVLGFGSVAISLTPAANAAGARCNVSRDRIDRANTDKRPWNDVDTAGRKTKDLPCSDAIALVGRIRLSEKGTGHESAPSESAVRIQGFFGIVLGLGQGISASLVLRGQNRTARNCAVAFSAFGIVFPVLGPISWATALFVIYALMFSAPAKRLWGRAAS
jgi:hypothetical protein